MMWIIILVVLVVMVYIFTRITIIHPNHVVACCGIGRKFTRILKEGVHVLPFLEWTIDYNWTYTDQKFKTHRVSGTHICISRSQIDMVPIECETADNQVCSLDTLLIYNVSDPQKAVYVSHDPLNLMCQQVIKYARKIVATHKKDALSRNEIEIGVEICKAIATEWSPTYGLSLDSCEIQCISFDEDTLRRRRHFRDGLSPSERSRINQAHELSKGNGKILLNP